MDVITALRDFERLTGQPAHVLDSQIEPYGVTIQDILAGRLQPSQFLLCELTDLLANTYSIAVDSFGDDPANWDFLYRSMQESRAFREYCVQAHGNALVQINELDTLTLGTIFLLLNLSERNRLLDVGCGNGQLTEFISDITLANILGVDHSPYAIGLALERTAGKRDRLDFQVGQIDRLDETLAGYPRPDTILALETLYAAGNLEATLRLFTRLLASPGQMLFIANQHIRHKESESQRLLPENTAISLALRALGWSPQVIDLTENKRRFLEGSLAVLESMQQAFVNEGNRDFWAARLLYDRKMLKRVEEGLTRRYLYYMKK